MSKEVSFNSGLTVQKIANGWLIVCQMPIEPENRFKNNGDDPAVEYFGGRRIAENLVWYCPTKKAVKDIIPKITLEFFSKYLKRQAALDD